MAASAVSSISFGAVSRHLVRSSWIPESRRCSCSRSAACCLRNLSDSDEFILRAEVAGERCVAVQVYQIHRTANQITDTRAHTVKNRRRQAGNSQVEIGGGVICPFCSGAKDINVPCAGGF